MEYSLSVDNIFIFVLIFSAFGVPQQYQLRVLFWGIFSALLLRGFMIGAGVSFIESFHWAFYLFGAFLVLTGLKMFWHQSKQVDFKNHLLVRLTRRFVPITDHYHGPKFSMRLEGGRRVLTPLALESLKGKRCCRQIKFYSGVSLLTSRWFCLSRILRAGPRAWSYQILKGILFADTPQLKSKRSMLIAPRHSPSSNPRSRHKRGGRTPLFYTQRDQTAGYPSPV